MDLARRYFRFLRQLRWQWLPDVVEKTFTIHEEETLPRDIHRALFGVVPPFDVAAIDVNSHIASIIKLGVIALEVPLSPTAAPSLGRLSLVELSRLGLFERPDTTEILEDGEPDDLCLTQMLEEAGSGRYSLQVRVEAANDSRNFAERMEQLHRGEVAPGYFPAKFRVTDAGVCNCPTLWTMTHFEF